MALDNENYEFPDEKEVTAVTEDASDGLEVDIVDDTPEEDRGRTPLPQEKVEELEKDDLSDYSDKVKRRMSELRKVYHDERREKEAAAREREEALRFAQAVAEENKRLKSTLTTGEKSYIEVSKQAAEQDLALATKEYREAYESADTDKLIIAQQRMNAAQMKLTQVANYRPQYENALQEQETRVNIQPERTQVARPDDKALSWQAKNTWFGQDEEMTSLALGLHEKLIRSGVSASSDEYYRRIDNTMRLRFPEQFEDDSLDKGTPTQRSKPSTVVASASRSTAPKKVQLTKTQLALAKKFGLSPEQYARELIKLEKN